MYKMYLKFSMFFATEILYLTINLWNISSKLMVRWHNANYGSSLGSDSARTWKEKKSVYILNNLDCPIIVWMQLMTFVTVSYGLGMVKSGQPNSTTIRISPVTLWENQPILSSLNEIMTMLWQILLYRIKFRNNVLCFLGGVL